MEFVAQIIQLEDPSRLVSSAHGDLPDMDALNIAPSIQVWGMNVYNGISLNQFLKNETISDKPMYFAELEQTAI